MNGYLNAKTLGMAAVAVIGLVVAYPSAAAYLPLLLFAASPLMMMGGRGHKALAMVPGSAEPAIAYVCPMHSEIRSTFPGKCPKCGMELKPAEAARPNG